MTQISFADFIAQKKYGYAGIAAILIGLLLVAVSIYGLHEINYWQKHGLPVQGIVLDKYIKTDCTSGGSNGSQSCIDNHFFKYRYSLNSGQKFIGKDSVNEDDWNAKDIGSEISMLYSSIQPSKSSVSYATGIETQKILWFLVIIFGGLATIFGALSMLKLRNQWKQI